MDIKHATLNKKVQFTRRNGQLAKGVISSMPELKPNGVWVQVNTGDKKKPDITNVRVANLSLQGKDTAPAAASAVKVKVAVADVKAKLKPEPKKPAPAKKVAAKPAVKKPAKKK